jgi:phage virion morphogenesis protein
MKMDTELAKLDHWIGDLAAALDDRARAKAAKKIARGLRGRTAKRLAAQRDPEGRAFAPRRKSTAPPPKRTLKFLYPAGGNGPPRRVLMKSWKADGGLFIGYDREAGGLRSFDKRKIIRYLPLEPGEQVRDRPSSRRSVKDREMFRKLRTYRFLRAESDADGAAIGYHGVAARIARVHQEGRFDDVAEDAPRVRYEERRLLGLNASDEAFILDVMREMIEDRG